MVLVLEPVKDNLLLLFFGSMVFTSLLEFIAGFAMERIFHDKWWDYSNNPFNIKGYICLEFSIIWGIACVLVVDVIHPIIMKLVNAVPHTLGLWLMAALYVILAADAVLTLVELLKLPKRFKAMEAADKREIYVLVVGETSRAMEWSLYGYERPTTPCLEATEGLVYFRDAVTQSNNTHKSVPIILSPACAEEYDDAAADRAEPLP